jgi:mandelamide amidase
LPILVKDNIDTSSAPTTAGTPALRDDRPSADATVVASLFAAGAILLGKTNMHELAVGITNNNAAFGAVRNPYNLALIPDGSSGGNGAAIAARMCPIGLGTDTGASVRIPSAHCGIVGLRPTMDRCESSCRRHTTEIALRSCPTTTTTTTIIIITTTDGSS